MLVYKMKLELVVDSYPEKNVEPKCTPYRKKKGYLYETSLRMIDWPDFNKKMGQGQNGAVLSMVAYQSAENGMLLMAASHGRAVEASDVELVVREFMHDSQIVCSVCQIKDFQEITLKELCNILNTDEYSNLCDNGRRYLWDEGISSLGEVDRYGYKRGGCHLKEHIPNLSLPNKKKAMSHQIEIMGHASLKEELMRIYSPKSHKGFAGHPVHYIVRGKSRLAAMHIIDALVAALYANKRVASNRISYFSRLEDGSINSDNIINTVLKYAGNTTVVLEIPNKTSFRGFDGQDEILRSLGRKIRNYCYETLFILVEVEDSSREVSSNLLKHLEGSMDWLLLREGSGNAEQARRYMNYLACQSEQRPFETEVLMEAMPEGNYTTSDVLQMFDPLLRKRLCREYYPDYAEVKLCTDEAEANERVSAGKSLKEMEKLVGLAGPKVLIRRMVALQKLRQIKKDFKMQSGFNSMHMVFAGNPGSAKTTMARLLAKILLEEQVLKTGAFVECGRGDLVGKYVGWTAKLVKQKFKEASGGVLFIDEAYALLEDHNSFGTEAINTIVQEMENHRDDVLVIFAGYPDKMRDFIDYNEGMRSRIAMYVDFPDYNVEELLEILKLMANERGCRLSPSIFAKCREMFSEAVQAEDFGNGRYVRNVLETAIMNQAERLMADTSRSITRQMAASLRAEDFVPVKVEIEKVKKGGLGFSFEE